MLIDSHAHITDEQYGDGGKGIIASMTADNLAAIVCVGCDEQSTLSSIAVAHTDPRIFASVGVHPYYPETVTQELLDKFKRLAESDEKVVAVGEFGLDYHHDEYDREAQIRAMNAQYDLARELKLPIIFHVREATGDFTEFLRTREFPESGVMHCFSGSVETAEICLKKGLYLSFGGKLTYKNSKHLQDAAKHAPLERILIETDAPYLSPAQKLGEINYPKNVAFVRDKLAELKGISPDEAEKATAENTKRLFFRMKSLGA
ncbi:MAG: TatD family hydrolase [Clostridiales bacterium]|nr:TatD family hydrolase [Clostridiales bacterium]